MQVKISYRTTLPAQGINPKVTIIDDEINTYFVVFIDKMSGKVIYSGYVTSNNTITGSRQWFTWWQINVYKGKEKVYSEDFNPYGKNIFIKIDATALGDNLAWMPYVEEFRVKHNCNMICSTFFNDLFKDQYPNILFSVPNTQLENVYAQYYIGSRKPDNICYSPRPYGKITLQQAASDILGLEDKELKAKISKPNVPKTKTVCISEHGSTDLKQWDWDDDWQQVVDYFVSEGYEVMVISKEPTELKRVTNKTGNLPLSDRIKDLCQSEFFLGVSSGLSWLAHSCDTYVFIISDHTPTDHEFKENCTRIYSDKCRKEVIQKPVRSNITPKQVIDSIIKVRENKYILMGIE